MTSSDDIQIQYHYISDGPDLTSRKYRLKDGSRTIRFEGIRLASVSSEREDRPRWTVIDLYRTTGGHFVVHRVGVSAVVHLITCSNVAGKRLPGPFDIKPDEISIEQRSACPTCRPDIKQQMKDDPASLKVEVDRHWTSVTETAPEMIDSLYTTRNGSKSLSFLASNLIKEAAEHDAEISAAVENGETVVS